MGWLKMIRLFLAVILLAHTAVFAAADLEIRSIKALPGDRSQPLRVHLTLDIINHGPEPASNIGCNVYVYANQRLLLSQHFAFQPLAPNQDREEALEIDLPSDSATAIKVEVYDSLQPDTQPSTNFLQANIKPPDYKRSDLNIEDSNIETVQPLFNKAVLTLKLINNGPDPLPYSKLTINLVVYDNVVDSTDRRLPRLASGEETELKIPFNFASSYRATEGRIEILFASPDPDVLDPVPENNKVSIPVQLIPRLPDLIPQNIKIDKRGVLTFEVLNKGNVRSSASVTALYINGALVQRFNTPELPPGSPQRVQYATKIPVDSYITVVCDFNADVEEASEENNRLNYRQN
jgi:subtilase family serine protease